MRTLLLFTLLVAVVVCWTGIGFALQEIGSPIPKAPQGGFAAGIGYTYFNSQWEYDGGDYDGEALPGDISQNFIYAQGSYGFLPGWEGYATLGVASATIDEALSTEDGADEAVAFETDRKFYFGVGLRGVIYGTETFQVGPFLQYNKLSTYEEDLEASFTGNPVDVPVTFADAYDLNVGLGLNYPVGAAGMLYGGVFAYWAKGSGEFELPDPIGTISQDFQEQGSVGGFLGLRLPIGSGLNLNFEGGYKSDISAGISINKAFGM